MLININVPIDIERPIFQLYHPQLYTQQRAKNKDDQHIKMGISAMSQALLDSIGPLPILCCGPIPPNNSDPIRIRI